MSDSFVQKLMAYHMPEGDVIEPVAPAPISRTRLVAISEQDAEVLENVGSGLCKLGSPDAGLVLLNIATAWKLAG